MKIAFVGCGYVFDIYMRTRWAHPELDIRGVFDIDSARAATVAAHYGLHAYPDFETLLSDPDVDTVINLTNIGSHAEVTRRAIEAGKHVYSEKPLTTDVAVTRSLFELAERHGVTFTGAPCNLYSDAVSTLWKAVRDGAIGKPVLVYAELDSNPAHLMHFEDVRSPTGAPWPYVEEFQEGCTYEHVGYHLGWICAMFGPAISVTAFSKSLIEHKTDAPLDPADTPDYSVGCLDFANGVTARVTCSVVAPRDHRLRVIGEEGELCVDDYSRYQSPVRLERFSRVSLAARKLSTVRFQPLVGRLVGVGGRPIPLVRRWKSHAVEDERGAARSPKQRFVAWVRRREIYSQDKLLGIAEMSRAMSDGRPQPMPPDFLMHVNELTILIQGAGPKGVTTTPTTSFEPLEPLADVADAPMNYRTAYKPRLVERLFGGAVGVLHRN